MRPDLKQTIELGSNHVADLASSLVEEEVILTTRDGCRIRATHYLHPHEPVKFAAVLNGGAGVPSAFYKRFARYLAARGISVLCYDYRGIARSGPTSLRGYTATVEDWAEYDCTAAVDWITSRKLCQATIGIGHSIGSVFLCGACNAENLDGMILIGPHTGYVGDYSPMYRLPMALFWHGVMPLLTTAFGYFPGRMLGVGTDIPKGVALQWAQRRSPTPLPRASCDEQTDSRRHALLQRLARTESRALIVAMTDDSFATMSGVNRFLAMLPNLEPTYWRVTPADAGCRKLGHFGFFRRNVAETLWPSLLKRIEVLSTSKLEHAS